MIELTRLNGAHLAVNCDLILFAESAPDTLLTMVTGEKLIVTESVPEVIARVAKYRAQTMAEATKLSPETDPLPTGAGRTALTARDAALAAGREDDCSVEEQSAEVMRQRRRSPL